MKLTASAMLFICVIWGCNNLDKPLHFAVGNKAPLTENPYKLVQEIPLPEGYQRMHGTDSFYNWLGNVGLKKDKTVFTFDKKEKKNQRAQFAVLDISVGNQNLQQCADAVMRLRAEYLFAQKQFASINFTDNNGKQYSFSPPYTRAHFDKYLNVVFGMCGSASLAKQMKVVTNFAAIKAGDVIVRGGFPGHAVIVMELAQNNKGKKIYLLAQSYMPAQDIHLLVNPMNTALSPWYEVNENTIIRTPEYTFKTSELKEWN